MQENNYKKSDGDKKRNCHEVIKIIKKTEIKRNYYEITKIMEKQIKRRNYYEII